MPRKRKSATLRFWRLCRSRRWTSSFAKGHRRQPRRNPPHGASRRRSMSGPRCRADAPLALRARRGDAPSGAAAGEAKLPLLGSRRERSCRNMLGTASRTHGDASVRLGWQPVPSWVTFHPVTAGAATHCSKQTRETARCWSSAAKFCDVAPDNLASLFVTELAWTLRWKLLIETSAAPSDFLQTLIVEIV